MRHRYILASMVMACGAFVLFAQDETPKPQPAAAPKAVPPVKPTEPAPAWVVASQPGRYALSGVEGGIVFVLDTQTGDLFRFTAADALPASELFKRRGNLLPSGFQPGGSGAGFGGASGFGGSSGFGSGGTFGGSPAPQK